MSDINESCLHTGCLEPVYAKGYCRKHYNSLWRSGKIGNRSIVPGMSRKESDSMHSLERQLEEAKETYKNSYSLASRVHWRKEITEIEQKIEEDRKASEAVVTSVAEVVDTSRDSEDLEEFLNNG